MTEPNLLVILNDNQMSISENVGGLTKMLGRMTGSRTLNALREGGKKAPRRQAHQQVRALRAPLGRALERHVRAINILRGNGVPLHRPHRRTR